MTFLYEESKEGRIQLVDDMFCSVLLQLLVVLVANKLHIPY